MRTEDGQIRHTSFKTATVVWKLVRAWSSTLPGSLGQFSPLTRALKLNGQRVPRCPQLPHRLWKICHYLKIS